jgi:hypothetical protein
MEFYKIWRGWGGTIGVNRLTLGDLIMNNLLVVAIYLILLALFVVVLPTFMLGIYVLWLLSTDMEGGVESPNMAQRQVILIMGIISSVYFMVDFHNGWIAYKVLGSMTYKETMDGIAIYNLSIGILSTVLFLFGHTIYGVSTARFGRVILILVTVWFGFKLSKQISTPIVNNTVTQCTDNKNVNEARQRYIDTERYNNGEYIP